MIGAAKQMFKVIKQMKNCFKLQGLEGKYMPLEITILVQSSTP